MSSELTRQRAYVIAPNQSFVVRAIEALSTGFDASGSVDPRGIKAFAAAGPIAAVLVAESFPKPSPEQLAVALAPALGDAAMVLITREVQSLPDDTRFNGTVRFPVADKVLVSSVRRAIRSKRAAAADPRALQVEIEIRTLRLADQAHYEVLGVAPDAGLDQITAAYDILSLRYHPDRLRMLDDESSSRALSLYMRVGEAYRVLRSRNARMRYDHSLSGGGTGGEATKTEAAGGVQMFADLSHVAAARKYLGLAQKALIAGDRAMALAHLRFAATQDEANAQIGRKIAEVEAGG